MNIIEKEMTSISGFKKHAVHDKMSSVKSLLKTFTDKCTHKTFTKSVKEWLK